MGHYYYFWTKLYLPMKCLKFRDFKLEHMLVASNRQFQTKHEVNNLNFFEKFTLSHLFLSECPVVTITNLAILLLIRTKKVYSKVHKHSRTIISWSDYDTYPLEPFRGLKTLFFHLYCQCDYWTQPCTTFQCSGHKYYQTSSKNLANGWHTRYVIDVEENLFLLKSGIIQTELRQCTRGQSSKSDTWT